MASQVISTAFYGVYIIFSAIHGDKSQSERDHVLRSFRDGRTPILVATERAISFSCVAPLLAVRLPSGPTCVE